MNKAEWVDRGAFLLGIPCLTHRDSIERCLFGEKGQLYPVTANTLSAIIYCKHYEKLVQNIPGQDLAKWRAKLKVPRYRSSQLKVWKKMCADSGTYK